MGKETLLRVKKMKTRLQKLQERLQPKLKRLKTRTELKISKKAKKVEKLYPKKTKETKAVQSVPESESIKEPFKDGEKELNTIYQNIRSVPNFSAKINDFLRKNEIHSKYRRIVKHKFPRRRIIVNYPYQIFMSDLIEYSQSGMRFANQGYVYILIFIDCFTRKVFARPLKKKNAIEMSHAINSILNDLENYPNSIITDEGLEYYNSKVRTIFANHAIHHYSIKTKMKASIVERFNRTIKSRFQKYFEAYKTKKWINVLPEFISNYNRTYHRSIGMSPDQVTDKNSKQVFEKLYPNIHLKVVPRLLVGDKVRILKEKSIFEKGYSKSWSEEIYRIRKVKQTAGRVWYEIETLNSERVPGIKYYWELNFINRENDR